MQIGSRLIKGKEGSLKEDMYNPQFSGFRTGIKLT